MFTTDAVSPADRMPFGNHRVDLSAWVGETVTTAYTATDSYGNQSVIEATVVVPDFTMTITCDPSSPQVGSVQSPQDGDNFHTVSDAYEAVSLSGTARPHLILYSRNGSDWVLGSNGEPSVYTVVEQNLTVSVAPGEDVVFDAGVSGNVFQIRGSTNSTWTGLEVKDADDAMFLFGRVNQQTQVTTVANDCSVREITCRGGGRRAMYLVHDGDGNSVVACTITGTRNISTSNAGIEVGLGQTNFHIVHTSSGNTPLSGSIDGIRVEHQHTTGTIEGCDFSNNSRQGILVLGKGPGTFEGPIVRVLNNLVSFNDDAGIQIENGVEWG